MQLVANLGFPAIVTMYLLVRIEGKLENLSIGINNLNSNLTTLGVFLCTEREFIPLIKSESVE